MKTKNLKAIKRFSLVTRYSLLVTNKGFTLVELLLALLILTLVMAIIGTGYRLGAKAWEKGESETKDSQRLRITSGLISQQLKSFYPYAVKKEEGEMILFEGTDSSVLFATTSSDGIGIKWVRYSFREGTIFFQEGILPDKDLFEKIEGAGKNEEVIEEDISDLKLQYLSEKEGWIESWEPGKDIPKAVKVKLGYFQPFLITIPMGAKTQKDTS
ncbi:MAG: prepilin-type N-terminal cleavage/methylation domain-containing protein [Nitrospirae bacterium]|nr:prepilin-type N-terminal cleavage/methylation domain-containing protein [Nitrospirota bacterium]